MKCERIEIGSQGAFLETYFLSESPEMAQSHRHRAVLICPGGAYAFCSDREAEPIAMAFCARGISCAVLRYPIAPVRYPAQLCAAAQAMAWMRSHAEENHLDPDDIAISGFSAGGHLAASLGVFWNRPFLRELTGLTPEQMKPNRMVLCYPVISSGEFSHAYSFQCLLGEEDYEDPEKLAFQSLENQVSPDTPPTFLWHTVTDPAVPVENSMFFGAALRRAGVPFEMHLYSVGGHGLSLANEITGNAQGEGVEPACTGWIDLAAEWLKR